MSISERARAKITEMPEREHDIAELFRIAGEEWAEADAAYYLLENTRTSLRSEITLRQTGIPNNRAEHIASASPEYRDHVKKAADAKRHANRLRVRMDYLKMRYGLWNSADANQRTERKLVRQAT